MLHPNHNPFDPQIQNSSRPHGNCLSATAAETTSIQSNEHRRASNSVTKMSFRVTDTTMSSGGRGCWPSKCPIHSFRCPDPNAGGHFGMKDILTMTPQRSFAPGITAAQGQLVCREARDRVTDTSRPTLLTFRLKPRWTDQPRGIIHNI